MPTTPTKRGSAASTVATPSAKKTKGQLNNATAAPLSHPTLIKLQEGLATSGVRDFLKGGDHAKPYGGLDEFSLDAYKAAMKKSKEYTCVVSAASIDPLKTVHLNIIPSVGTLQSCPSASFITELILHHRRLFFRFRF